MMASFRQVAAVTLLCVLLGEISCRDVPPADYEARRGSAKQDYIWQQIQKTVYTTLPTNEEPDKRNLTDPTFLIKTLTLVSDEIPAGRTKLTHQFGIVCKAELEMFINSPFTGLFTYPGATYGIARLSVTLSNDPTFFAANIALKILIDGKPSVNFNALESLEGRFATDRNFFSQTLTNTIPDPLSPTLVFINQSFNRTLQLLADDGPLRPESSTKLGLYEHASINAGGTPVTKVVAPWKIEFVPNPVLKASQDNLTGDFRTKLATIPEGTVLYDIVLYRQHGYPGQFVGRLSSRSPLIASSYGDEVLFFQHANKRWQA